MTLRRTRRELLGALAAGSAATAGCLGSGSIDPSSGGTSVDWRTAELTDVTSGETFTIDELDGPVLAHPFAIWCSTCGAQNRELDALQEDNNYEIVQLNIGEGENDDDVLAYAEDNGYGSHSRFAVVSNEVAGSLADEFGPQAVSPPQSPVILVCSDGGVSEFEKVSTPETLESGIETRCE